MLGVLDLFASAMARQEMARKFFPLVLSTIPPYATILCIIHFHKLLCVWESDFWSFPKESQREIYFQHLMTNC